MKYDFQGHGQAVDAENRLIYMIDESGVLSSLFESLLKSFKKGSFIS